IRSARGSRSPRVTPSTQKIPRPGPRRRSQGPRRGTAVVVKGGTPQRSLPAAGPLALACRGAVAKAADRERHLAGAIVEETVVWRRAQRLAVARRRAERARRLASPRAAHLQDAPSEDLPAFECGGGLVDLVEPVAAGDERVQVEAPIGVPLQEDWEVPARVAGAPDRGLLRAPAPKHRAPIPLDSSLRPPHEPAPPTTLPAPPPPPAGA